MRIVMFNGPPRSGKDVAGEALPGYKTYKFAQPIDDAILALLGRTSPMGLLYQRVVNNPERKDEKLFNGRSCRELKISFSEQWVKPNFGNDTFGKLCAGRVVWDFGTYPSGMPQPRYDGAVITDCGFQAEFDAFCADVKSFNPSWQIELIRVRRRGFTFASGNDSREYVAGNDYTDREIDLDNNASLSNYRGAIRALVHGGVE